MAELQSIFRPDLFQQHNVLVTGGGSGLGLRCAREFALLGARVFICGRSEDKLAAAAAQINQAGGRAEGLVCDIRDRDAVGEMMQTLEARAGKLDILINNAGGQFPAPAETISAKGWQAVIDTNLTGTFNVMQAAFNKHFRKKGGVIVNVIADMWQGFPMMAHTGAARAAVDNLTKTLANEWGRHGVRVNAIAPGIIRTSGLATYDAAVRPMIEEAGKQNQATRMGTEAEVAAALLFLASPAATYITGATLRVDGGQSLFHPLYPPNGERVWPSYDDPA